MKSDVTLDAGVLDPRANSVLYIDSNCDDMMVKSREPLMVSGREHRGDREVSTV